MATLAELTTTYNTANTNYGNAVTDRDNKYSSMSSYYSAYIVNCKYGVIEKFKFVKQTPGLGVLLTTDKCLGNVNANDYPGCGSQSTCKTRVVEYNELISNYNNAVNNVGGKKIILDSAERELKAHPDYSKSVIEAGVAGKNTRTVVIVIAIVVVIAVLTWIVIYMKKKGVF